jgi:hypothetical protein
VVDERKATALSQSRFPKLVTMSTMDLFASESVRSQLGHDRLKDAIFMALLHGRMQVPKIHLDWVLGLIGPEKAIQCLSLPSFTRVLTPPDVAKQGRKSQQRYLGSPWSVGEFGVDALVACGLKVTRSKSAIGV